MKNSMHNFALVLATCFLLLRPEDAFCQLTRDWYDEAHRIPTSSYYLFNESKNLAWGETYMQSAILDLYETSGDLALLDEMVTRLDTMMNTLWDAPPPGVPCNRAIYEDGFLGWGSSYYDPGGSYQEYMVHDGMILVPITRFIRYIYSDSSLHSAYGAKADFYLNTIESNLIAKWHANWKGAPGNSGETLEDWGGYDHLPNNQYAIFGAAMAILYELSSNEHYTPSNPEFPTFYFDKSTEMANYFKGFMTHRQDVDAYLWGYRWTYPPAEDITYGYMEMIFVLEAYHRGIAFDLADMERYTNTFTELMWNGDLENPHISQFIDGSGPNQGYFSWTWTALSELDFRVWEIVHSYHERNFGNRRKEGISNLALGTQLYDVYSPDTPTNLTLETNDGSTNLNWEAPVVDEGGARLTGLAGYNVYRSEVPGGPYTQINDTVLRTTKYPDIDTAFYHAVTAVDYHIPPNESPFADTVTGIALDDDEELVSESHLLQNHPNPFSAGTVISYSLSGAETRHVRIDVYDSGGRLVANLVDGLQAPGEYQTHWDGQRQNGETAASGIYLYKMETGTVTVVKEMILMK